MAHDRVARLVTLKIRHCSSIEQIGAHAWERLATDDNPFVSYAFLRALEANRCVGAHTGWTPRFLAAWQGEKLVGAVPLYLKDNSYGEFVFDWNWADAYRQCCGDYYPKLVVAAPYTPATGPRLLLAPDVGADNVAEHLIQATLEETSRLGVSSLHWLFTTDAETRRLEGFGLARRMGLQYHWHNPGYRDFEDYLEGMAAAKRKKIRRERRRVGEQGIEIRVRLGSELSGAEWDTVHALYSEIYRRKWGYATLTAGFFREIGQSLGDRVVLVLAYLRNRCIAGAINLCGGGVLYGRHWGCFGDFHSLHFEVCYYQGIDYCIAHGLHTFEPGAQGEHKISRGFLPVRTWSAHWIERQDFRRAVERFLRAESREMDETYRELARHSPFKDGVGD